MLLKTLTLAIAIGGASLTAAEAMPIAAAPQPIASNVIQVDYACGRGYHLTRWGDCRPEWRRPPRVVWYGDRGWHRPPRAAWYGDRGWRRPPPPPWAYGWGHRPPRRWDDQRW